MPVLAPAAVGTPAYTRGSEGVHSLSAVSASAARRVEKLRFSGADAANVRLFFFGACFCEGFFFFFFHLNHHLTPSAKH